MPSFTFHPPSGSAGRSVRGLDKAVLVRDAFSPAAFVFNVLWAFWHRMWLVGFLILLVKGVLVTTANLLDVHPIAAGFVDLLLSVVIGLEAATIRNWHLRRKGKPAALLVIADDEDGAETKAVALWARHVEATTQPPPTPVRDQGVRPYRPSVPEAGPVLGLFPDSQVKR